MEKLVDILQACPEFNDPSLDTYVPLDKQALFLKLAEKFQASLSHIYEDPEELTLSIGLGTPEIWEEFLNLDPVQMYTMVRSKNHAKTTSRKALRNLQIQANKGDVAAIKYLNDISGTLAKQGDAGQVILHYVPRPKPKMEVDDSGK
ncbi:hypothetical protein D1872_90140 [compost metagenome]